MIRPMIIYHVYKSECFRFPYVHMSRNCMSYHPKDVHYSIGLPQNYRRNFRKCVNIFYTSIMSVLFIMSF